MSSSPKSDKLKLKTKPISHPNIEWEQESDISVDFMKYAKNISLSFHCFKEPTAFEKTFLDLSENKHWTKMVELLKKELE
ncbi:MAG: hypothetical protein GF383_14255 [Candidatus Lokiarchaeota archaeon]|nr:hypothetical protein [Candidatus Lokiarchaeota archaeon]MBD3342530.1 hypothetical protein [Candidatus Lokiarchaeota archaeon]